MTQTKIMLPTFIIHYHLSNKSPFLNLSDLEENELQLVLADLDKTRKENEKFNRVYGGRYMDLRKKTENKLRNKFVQESMP